MRKPIWWPGEWKRRMVYSISDIEDQVWGSVETRLKAHEEAIEGLRKDIQDRLRADRALASCISELQDQMEQMKAVEE